MVDAPGKKLELEDGIQRHDGCPDEEYRRGEDTARKAKDRENERREKHAWPDGDDDPLGKVPVGDGGKRADLDCHWQLDQP